MLITTARQDVLKLCAGVGLLLSLCLGTYIPTAQAAPLVIDQPRQYSLAGHLENLVDKSGTLTFSQMLADSGSRFVPLPGFVNRGYLNGASWTRFSYTTPTDLLGRWYLRLVPAFLDDIRVFVQEGPDPASAASYREYQLGDHYPAAGRPIPHLDLLAPLPSAAAPRMVYVRVKTTSTHNLQGWIASADDLLAWSGTYSLINGVIMGVLLVVTLANAFYAFLSRSSVFAWYSLFVLSNMLRQLGLDGALFVLLPSIAHHVNDWLVGGGVCMVLATFSLFAMSLFSTRKHQPRTHRYLQTNILIAVLTAVCIPLGWYGRMAPIMIVCLLLLSGMAPVLAYAQVRRHEPGSGLIMFGFTAALLPAIPRFLSVLGLISSTWITTNSYIFGLLIQALIMTIAMIERLHITQEKLLAVTREAEARASKLAEARNRELSDKKRELELALEEKQRAYDQQSTFVNMISHEFRTPLAIVSGNLEIIEERGSAEGPLAGPLVKIGRAVKRIVEVYQIVLERSRLDAIMPRLDRQQVNPALVAEDALLRIGELWPDRSIRFTATAAPDIMIDRVMLGMALFNLLDNANKYTPAGESIDLIIGSDNSGMFFEVRDTGPGFAHGEEERVFDKYHRGAASVGTVGAGIGLWLVREMVTAHGGSVAITDNRPHGAVVTIRLPTGTITPPVLPLS